MGADIRLFDSMHGSGFTIFVPGFDYDSCEPQSACWMSEAKGQAPELRRLRSRASEAGLIETCNTLELPHETCGPLSPFGIWACRLIGQA